MDLSVGMQPQNANDIIYPNLGRQSSVCNVRCQNLFEGIVVIMSSGLVNRIIGRVVVPLEGPKEIIGIVYRVFKANEVHNIELIVILEDTLEKIHFDCTHDLTHEFTSFIHGYVRDVGNAWQKPIFLNPTKYPGFTMRLKIWTAAPVGLNADVTDGKRKTRQSAAVANKKKVKKNK